MEYKSIIFYILIVLLLNCSSKNNKLLQDDQEQVVVKSDFDSIGDILATSDSDIVTFDNNHIKDDGNYKSISLDSLYIFPDTSLYMFKLENPYSVVDILSDTIVLNEENNIYQFPFIVLLSKSKELEITFLFYPGNRKWAFSKFIIRKKYQSNCKAIQTSIEDTCFKSSHGAFIGMKEEDFLSIYGFSNQDKIYSGTNKMMYYELLIDDYENSNFLQQYKMPEYIAKYYFKDNELVEISIGFEYP